MAYTAAQYAAQERVMAQIRTAHVTGACPICGCPSGLWPDGVRHITCGRNDCLHRWLAIRPPVAGAPSASAANFTVSLVIR
jgi:hypothetical protein